MRSKISLITLGVKDVKRASDFYKKLGFEVGAGDGEDMVMFKLNDTWLGLFPKDRLAEDAGIPVGAGGFSGITMAHNEPSKADVDATFQHFINAGASVVKPAHDTFWGGYSGYVADPDGYLWEICWNPFTDLT